MLFLDHISHNHLEGTWGFKPTVESLSVLQKHCHFYFLPVCQTVCFKLWRDKMDWLSWLFQAFVSYLTTSANLFNCFVLPFIHLKMSWSKKLFDLNPIIIFLVIQLLVASSKNWPLISVLVDKQSRILLNVVFHIFCCVT